MYEKRRSTAEIFFATLNAPLIKINESQREIYIFLTCSGVQIKSNPLIRVSPQLASRQTPFIPRR